jgi:hypothetical protein
MPDMKELLDGLGATKADLKPRNTDEPPDEEPEEEQEEEPEQEDSPGPEDEVDEISSVPSTEVAAPPGRPQAPSTDATAPAQDSDRLKTLEENLAKLTELLTAQAGPVKLQEEAEELEEPPVPQPGELPVFVTPENIDELVTDAAALNQRFVDVYLKAREDAIKGIEAVLPHKLRTEWQRLRQMQDRQELEGREFTAANAEVLADIKAKNLGPQFLGHIQAVEATHKEWGVRRQLDEALKNFQKEREAYLKAEGYTPGGRKPAAGVAPTPGSRRVLTRGQQRQKANSVIDQMLSDIGLVKKNKER